MKSKLGHEKAQHHLSSTMKYHYSLLKIKVKKNSPGAEETVQWLKAHTALLVDLSSQRPH